MLTLRMLEAEDAPKLEALLAHKRDQLGIDFRMPKLDETTTFIFEDEGELIGAVVFKQVWESTIISDNPKLMRGCVEFKERMRVVCNRKGIEDVIGFVPKSLVESERGQRGMARLLARVGYNRVDPQLIAFEMEI